MNENAAKFFLNNHYRLTDRAIAIQPILPPYIEENFVIKYSRESVFFAY